MIEVPAVFLVDLVKLPVAVMGSWRHALMRYCGADGCVQYSSAYVVVDLLCTVNL